MFSFANKNVKHNKLAKKRSKNRPYKRTDMAKFNRRFHGNAGDGHLHTHHMTPSHLLCRGVKRIQGRLVRKGGRLLFFRVRVLYLRLRSSKMTPVYHVYM